MNKILQEHLHRYAEDREIDYSSAQYLGEQFGIRWKSEKQLVEFKQVIDTYLKTFSPDSFNLVEMKLEELCGTKSRKEGEGSQDITHYAAKTKVSKPNVTGGKVGPKGKKKAVKK